MLLGSFAEAKIPVVKYSGGDGSSPEKAVIVTADNDPIGVSAVFDYLRQHFPGYEIGESSTHETPKRVIESYVLMKAPKKKKTLFFDITAFYDKSESNEEIAAKNDFAAATDKDGRIPTKGDLSGTWSVGPDLVGYVVQLDQKGESVTGRGYFWGCVGTIAMFEAAGTYKAGILRIKFSETTQSHAWHRFKPIEGKDGLQLVDLDSEYRETIYPNEVLAKRRKEAESAQ